MKLVNKSIVQWKYPTEMCISRIKETVSKKMIEITNKIDTFPFLKNKIQDSLKNLIDEMFEIIYYEIEVLLKIEKKFD